MSEKDIQIVSSKIDQEKEFLDGISLEIWNNPQLAFEEVHAHSLLTEALEKCGFDVQKEYILKTAFRAEFQRGTGDGPVIAVLCEYDALPEIGHACGHNLIAQSGIAAAIAVKAAMEADSTISGKIVILGAPAEEAKGGKLRLIVGGAFKNIDAAIMVHPSPVDLVFATYLCVMEVSVTYIGKESHAAAYPWGGLNALDAAVSAYVNIGLLRQQMKPTWRIHTIITKGGTVANVIPGETKMEMNIRAPSVGELATLKKKVLDCLESAAKATGCQLECDFDDDNAYLNVITNKVIGSSYGKYAKILGMELGDGNSEIEQLFPTAGSTDMGNVSYVVPSIHALYSIGDKINHTPEFTQLSSTPMAHEKTRTVAKAMALTVLELMRNPELMKSAKETFKEDLERNQKAF